MLRPLPARAHPMASVFLCVTIDCECDKGPGWRVRRPLSFAGVTDGMARRLHPMFRRRRAKPTYLLSAEIMREERSLAALRSLLMLKVKWRSTASRRLSLSDDVARGDLTSSIIVKS